jgi:hypothetical protein
MTAVSSIRVRSAHGNSLDHLVVAGEHGRWNFEAQGFRRLEIDYQQVFGSLLHRQVRIGAFVQSKVDPQAVR